MLYTVRSPSLTESRSPSLLRFQIFAVPDPGALLLNAEIALVVLAGYICATGPIGAGAVVVLLGVGETDV